MLLLAIFGLGSLGWCREGLIYVKSIDGFVLTLPASISDAEIEKQLQWHDATAREFFRMAGTQGDPLLIVAPDGITYTFPPDAKQQEVERTLTYVYPSTMAHAIAYGLPVTDVLPEDRDYLLMIASGVPASEAAELRENSIPRVGRKSFAQGLRKGEDEHQRQLASRKPLLTTSPTERIAEARGREGWTPCKLWRACGLAR